MAKKGHFRPFWAVFLVALEHAPEIGSTKPGLVFPLGNMHILRPNMIGATGFATLMKPYKTLILRRIRHEK